MNEILHNNEQENQSKKIDLHDSEKKFLQIIEKDFPENKETLIQQRQELLQKHQDIQENLELFINKLMLCYDGISITKNDIKKYLFNTINSILSQDMYKDKPIVKNFLLQDKNIYIFRNKIIDNINKDKAVETTDKAVETTDKAVETTDKAVETTDKAVETTDKAVETTDKAVETTDKANKLRSKLKEKYITIEPNYKYKTQEELNTFKNQPKFTDILQKLPEEKHEAYFGYRFAAENIAKEARKSENKTISAEHYTFIQQFNTLDQELNLNSKIDISDLKVERQENKRLNTMDDIITNDKIGEELVARNESIQNFVQESKDLILDENKEQLFPIESVKNKVIERYPDKIEETLDELLTNNNLTQYKENFNPNGSLKNIENITEEDRKNLEKISDTMNDNITDFAEDEQDRMIIETNEIIKTKAVEALVKNIGQYFQVTNLQEGNLAEKISIDIENGVSFDQNMLTLSTNMDGRDIGFYYDMKNGEVRADDFIHYDGESDIKKDGVFFIDRNQDGKWRERLPIKMETLNQILTNSTSKTKDNIESSLENSNEPQEYRENLSEKTEISYQQKSSVGDIIIEHTMEKNTAVQEFHEFATEYMPTRNSYGRQKEQYEYNLYKIIDTSFDRYTADEIKQRNNLFQRFQNKINENNPSFNDEMISSLFDEDEAKQQKEGKYDLEKWPKIYQFIQALTYNQPGTIKNDVIDLNLFERVIQNLEKADGTTKDLTELSPKYEKLRNTYKEEQDKDGVDNIIDNNIDARENVA